MREMIPLLNAKYQYGSYEFERYWHFFGGVRADGI